MGLDEIIDLEKKAMLNLVNVLDPEKTVHMKIITFPSGKKEELYFHEDCTVLKVRERIAEFLQFTGTRTPDSQTFRMWVVSPRRELAKPLLTLRQMEVPMECKLLVLPHDLEPRCIVLPDDPDEVTRILSSLYKVDVRQNTDDRSNDNNDVSDPSNENNENSSTEESAPKRKSTNKGKASGKKSNDKETKPGKGKAWDEFFEETKEFRCKFCVKTFKSQRGAINHCSKMHKEEEKRGSTSKADLTVGTARRCGEPEKKKAKKEQSTTYNYVVNNIVNFNRFVGRVD